MKRLVRTGLLFLAALSCFCGKKGPILPPLEKIPQTVAGLTLNQVGLELHLSWRLPTSYLDGSPIETVSLLEMWRYEEEIEPQVVTDTEAALDPEAEAPEAASQIPLTPEKMRSGAVLWQEFSADSFSDLQPDPEGAPQEFSFLYLLNKEDVGLKKLGFSVKVRDSKGRSSDFSSWAAVESLNTVAPPSGLKAELSPQHIRLTWQAPEKNLAGSEPPEIKGYNLYRVSGDEAPQMLNQSLVIEPNYEDKSIEFGTLYVYLVRAVSRESSPLQESADSEPMEIKAEDSFPPAAPKGLIAISSGGTISLSWDLNQESDLTGYKLWRRPVGADVFELLTPEGIDENTYTDSRIQKNIRYDYAVSALDRAGNESPRSKSVTAGI
jgi:hypothetical protein